MTKLEELEYEARRLYSRAQYWKNKIKKLDGLHNTQDFQSCQKACKEYHYARAMCYAYLADYGSVKRTEEYHNKIYSHMRKYSKIEHGGNHYL